MTTKTPIERLILRDLIACIIAPLTCVISIPVFLLVDSMWTGYPIHLELYSASAVSTVRAAVLWVYFGTVVYGLPLSLVVQRLGKSSLPLYLLAGIIAGAIVTGTGGLGRNIFVAMIVAALYWMTIKFVDRWAWSREGHQASAKSS